MKKTKITLTYTEVMGSRVMNLICNSKRALAPVSGLLAEVCGAASLRDLKDVGGCMLTSDELGNYIAQDEEEQVIIDAFHGCEYMVFVNRGWVGDFWESVIKHEYSHVFFHLSPEYRGVIEEAWAGISHRYREEIEGLLVGLLDYDKESVVDEFGAYTIQISSQDDVLFPPPRSNKDKSLCRKIIKSFDSIWHNKSLMV